MNGQIACVIIEKEDYYEECFSINCTYKHQTRHSSVLLAGQESDVDVGEHTTAGNGGATHELGELIVVADSQLDVAGDNTGALVVTGGIACELEDLSGEVLKDGGEVHGGTGSNALGEATSTELAGDSSDGELKSCAG